MISSKGDGLGNNNKCLHDAVRSMASTRGSALKVSRSSSDNPPTNAPTDSHWRVIFDADNTILENFLTLLTVLETPCSCLGVTMYLPGSGFSASEIHKRREGVAVARRVQRAMAISWEQNTVEKLARERTEHGGLNTRRHLPKGWRRAYDGPTSIFIRSTHGAPLTTFSRHFV